MVSKSKDSLRSRDAKPSVAWVYFILCANGCLYVGAATNLRRRFEQHLKGHGALYTRLNRPLRLIGALQMPDRTSALRMERDLKRSDGNARRRMALFAATTTPWLKYLADTAAPIH